MTTDTKDRSAACGKAAACRFASRHDARLTIMRGSGPTTGKTSCRTPRVLPQDIRQYLEAENAYTERPWPAPRSCRSGYSSEMKGRIKEDDLSVPAPDGALRLLSELRDRRAASALLPQAARSFGHGADPHRRQSRSRGQGPSSDFGGFAVSPDHRLLAWSIDDKGSEFYPHPGPRPRHSRILPMISRTPPAAPAGSADGKSFLYTHQDEHHRPLKVFRHVARHRRQRRRARL